MPRIEVSDDSQQLDLSRTVLKRVINGWAKSTLDGRLA